MKAIEPTYLWEIYVPCKSNDGKPNRVRKHREWDRRVKRISGGMSIQPVIKGHWISPAGEEFIERMIPVRICCTRTQMMKIMEMTLKFYDQEAIMCARVSDEVIFLHKSESETT